MLSLKYIYMLLADKVGSCCQYIAVKAGRLELAWRKIKITCQWIKVIPDKVSLRCRNGVFYWNTLAYVFSAITDLITTVLPIFTEKIKVHKFVSPQQEFQYWWDKFFTLNGVTHGYPSAEGEKIAIPYNTMETLKLVLFMFFSEVNKPLHRIIYLCTRDNVVHRCITQLSITEGCKLPYV